METLAEETTTQGKIGSNVVPDIPEAEVIEEITQDANHVPEVEERPEPDPEDWDAGDEQQAQTLDADFSAELVICSADSLQRAILPRIILHKFRKKLDDDQKITLARAQIKKEEGRKDTEFDGREKAMLAKYADMEQKLEAIPFRDDEIDRLKKPLAAYMAKKGASVPPELGLIMGALEVIGGRVADVLID